VKDKGTIVVSGLVIAITLFLDQWTKWCIMSSMKEYQTIEIIHNFFNITYVKNTGAGFSLFEGFGIWFFSIVTIAALIVLVSAFIKMRDMRYRILISLIISGAIGNFIDRIRLGFVCGFFSFNLFGWHFPVFNVADICITVGFALLIVCMAYDDYKEKKRWKQQASE
jgi:signal peptidase II